MNEVVPTIITQIKKGSSSTTSSTNSSTSDTSFLKGADKRLSKPFLTGFNVSAVQIYWVGLMVLLVAFVLTWFFKVPPLRQRSALQEQADKQAAADQLDVEAGNAAAGRGHGRARRHGSGPRGAVLDATEKGTSAAAGVPSPSGAALRAAAASIGRDRGRTLAS